MDKTKKRLTILALFIFIISPILSWESILASDETAVFASLSRMIWYSGSSLFILIAVSAMFIPMILSFFYAQSVNGMSKREKIILRSCTIISCIVLYLGAMWVMPSDGTSLTVENKWHGILSFSGIFMVYLTYCLYTILIKLKHKDESGLLFAFLIFTLITSAFAILNVFDEKSYVVASAVAELYALTMLSLIGYLTFYLAYHNSKKVASESEKIDNTK